MKWKQAQINFNKVVALQFHIAIALGTACIHFYCSIINNNKKKTINKWSKQQQNKKQNGNYEATNGILQAIDKN